MTKLLALCFLLLPLISNAQPIAPSFEDTPEFLAWRPDPKANKVNGQVLSHYFKLIKPNGTTQVLDIKNASTLLKPASTMKLFTGWWAFDEAIRDDEFLAEMLKTSSNAMAQEALDALGTPDDMESHYFNLGLSVRASTLQVADGSGLSYDNQSTCTIQIELLEMIYNDSRYDTFKSFLAQPGEHGTLSGRLLNLRGKVFAKTGTLNRTAALSGFIEAPQGTIVFCVLSDYLTRSLAAERQRIDNLVTQNYNRAR